MVLCGYPGAARAAIFLVSTLCYENDPINANYRPFHSAGTNPLPAFKKIMLFCGFEFES